MESGYSRMDEEIHPQLLDLIPKERNWFLKREDDCNKDGSRRSHGHGHGGVSDEKKLELRLGPPGVEDWSLSSDAPKNYKSPSKAAAVQVPNTSQKSAPAPVVGWPPIRSFRKNIASNSSAKQAPSPDTQNGVISNKNIVKRVEESCQKGFFVKINMNGIPIGRKVDLNAYDSYGKLSIAVDELFRGLLAAQKDTKITGNQDQEKAITGLLDGSGEYTLVYEDNEGDRMLVGDVPWHMFVSTVKRLRVIRSTEISNLCLGSKQEKIHH
ncbi:auxin-responsive protein IAA26-like isoform X2 [Cynara cardunculus var. scolymus]|uniref:auxin-responsive protein IAA26-like isoform X2 n=1 Tax=Cynara cardunculus var. scolymus TaxID=59895 RepID=UPI000D62E30B|nr:auxin-responsive protein IAA26-like isoform X2 [Cynara cardunculus var. scolymus]